VLTKNNNSDDVFTAFYRFNFKLLNSFEKWT